MTHEQLSSQSGGETKIERKRLHSHPQAQTSSAPSSEERSVMCLGVSCEVLPAS